MRVVSIVKTQTDNPTLEDFMAIYKQLDIYDQREVFELAEQRIDDARDELRTQRWSWERDNSAPPR